MRRDYEKNVLCSDDNERCLQCRKNSGEEEEEDPCSSQADVHIYGGRCLHEHLQKKVLTTNQPANQPLCFCEEDNHLILERSLLGSLSRLKEKDSAPACLFSPRLKVEDSDHTLLCIVKCSTSKTVLTLHNT